MVKAGHGDAGGEEAHAGARHHVDLVGPQVVVQTRVLPTMIQMCSQCFEKLNFSAGFMKAFL